MKKRKFTYILAALVVLAILATLAIIIINRLHQESSGQENQQPASKQVAILSYHHIDTDSGNWSSITISPDKFESDMQAVLVAGFVPVTLKDLVNYVKHDGALPDKPVVITFDDGYLSNYQYAYPILQRLNIKATISVIGWSVGQTTYKGTDRPIIPHFTWGQAKEMADSGLIDIQNHTYDMHNDGSEPPYRNGMMQLDTESEEDYRQAIIEDLQANKQQIEKHIGNTVFNLTYPYGGYSALSEQIIADLGYEMTLTTVSGVNIITRGDERSLFGMKRINAGSEQTSQEIVEKMLYEATESVPAP